MIVSDQVVVHDGKIREKPENEDEARAFLRSYGKVCLVHFHRSVMGGRALDLVTQSQLRAHMLKDYTNYPQARAQNKA